MASRFWMRSELFSIRYVLSLRTSLMVKASDATSALAGSEAVSRRSGSHGVVDAFGYSVPVTGGKGKQSMSERTVRYTKGDIGRVKIVEDFLPSPAELVPVEDNVKVTLTLTRRSLDFFKQEAAKRRLPYQRMIRALVDQYAGKASVGRRKAR
jgi:predicted DNA binding CopG/RHH family protein